MPSELEKARGGIHQLPPEESELPVEILCCEGDIKVATQSGDVTGDVVL